MLLLLLLNLLIFDTSGLTCRDKSRDCPRRRELCFAQDEIRRNVMQSSCPYTCQSCGLQQRPIKGDMEITEPAMGRRWRCHDVADDCIERSHLCRRPTYKRMMTKQCSRTCGFCSDIVDEDDDVVEDPIVALVRSIKPRVRQSTIREIEESGLSLEELIHIIRAQEAATTTTTQASACVDLAYDCMDKMGLCTHKSYATLVKKLCRKTCNVCT